MMTKTTLRILRDVFGYRYEEPNTAIWRRPGRATLYGKADLNAAAGLVADGLVKVIPGEFPAAGLAYAVPASFDLDDLRTKGDG